jgi:aspartate/methionine/tyrosine aminotransferase
VAFGPDRRVVVTAGGNMGFINAILAVADPGDEVILPTPFYFNHEMAVTIAGCRVVLVATDRGYQLDLNAIRDALTPRTRVVATISPNNPSGAVYPERDIRAVNEICKGAGVYHVHDEAYEYFTYGDAKHFSPASIVGAERHTICLYSLSKSFGMASWRIGSMLIPTHLFDAVRKIQDTVLICPPVVSQYAALGALNAGAEYCRQFLRGIAEVRGIVLDELRSLGDRVEIPAADGAFYVFLRVRGTTMSSMQLVETLIRDFGVAVIPGSAFGVESDCAIRMSYGSLQRETALQGVGRLVRGLRAI